MANLLRKFTHTTKGNLMATITYAFFIGGVTSRGKKGATRENGNKKTTRLWW